MTTGDRPPTRLYVFLHATPEPDFLTVDPALIKAVVAEFGPAHDQLVMASELATVLPNTLITSALAAEEEPSMVRIVLN